MKTEQKIGRKLGDRCVTRTTFRIVVCGCAAIVAMSARAELTHAQPPQGNNGGPPSGPQVYQSQGFGRSHDGRDRRRDDFRQSNRFMGPQFNSGWFQRPYPTHLDYFRLRSNEAPPRYYGDWYGAPYGGWGQGPESWGPESSGYPPYETGNEASGQGVSPRALMMKTPLQENAAKNSSDAAAQDKSSTESLPPPKLDK
jgi:hypothetical protein